MFKKWWVILIQGILLILLGIFIFENPVEALLGASVWFGLMVLFAGLAGVAGWIFSHKENSENVSLIWSIVSVTLGLFVLFNLLAAMKFITVAYGLWVLITGYHLFQSGWSIKKETSIAWVLVLIALFSIVAGTMMLFNINTGATGFATILGIQVILAGIALILLAFVKKWLVSKVKNKVHSILHKN